MFFSETGGKITDLPLSPFAWDILSAPRPALRDSLLRYSFAGIAFDSYLPPDMRKRYGGLYPKKSF